MVSSPSTNLRLEYQATGEHINTWGATANTNVFQLLEEALTKRLAFSLSGSKTLVATNYASDEARCMFLDITGGTGGTITVPGVEKLYFVRNNASGDATLTTGSGVTATFKPGDIGPCLSDVTNVRQAVIRDFQGAKITGVGYPTLNTDAATMKYVLDQAFAASNATFPGQPGNANRYLGTNGTVASWSDPLPSQVGKLGQVLYTNGTDRTGAYWAFAGVQGRQTKAADYTVAAGDRETLIACTAGLNLTLPAAVSLDAKFVVYAQNASTGNVVLARTGADTIDGLSAYTMYPGEVRLFFCDGVSAWTSIVLSPFHAIYTATANFTYPPGYSAFQGEGYGGGGGGGGNDFLNGFPAAGGGAGGGQQPFFIPATEVSAGTTESFAIGAGGAAGVGAVSAGAGGTGGTSSIGARRTFAGSPGGARGTGGAASGAPNIAPYAGGAGSAPTGGGAVGAASVFGAGGGAGSDTAGAAGAKAGGTSALAGAGGACGANGASGMAGAAPGGGGGGAGYSAGANTNGGVGARGEIRIRGVL